MKIRICVDVPDLAKATAFYTSAFGLERGRRGQGWQELLGPGGLAFDLLEKESGSKPVPGGDATRSFSPHWTPVHLDFDVADLQAATARALAAGATVDLPEKTQSWGKLVNLRDPFGNGFCLIQQVGRGYDAMSAEDA